MKLTYDILDPTGNITILVRTPVPEEIQPPAAARLMALVPEAEQVGFLSPGEDGGLSLRMAGGEFCGNASMCAGVLYARDRGLTKARAHLSVSGAKGPVPVLVERQEEGWRGSVVMPRPKEICLRDLAGYGPCPLVFFPGIAHALIERPLDRERAEVLVRDWCRDLQTDAMGLMLLDRKEGRLTPLVYVPAAGTLCWENSCASGTSAVGAFRAAGTGGPFRETWLEPGGPLTVSFSEDGGLALTGRVRILGTKTAEILPEP